MVSIRELLNKLRWDPSSSLSDYMIVITHRGSVNGFKSIPGSLIKELGKHFFTYEEDGKLVVIPYHRVKEVKNLRLGVTVFKRG
ncbi:MAG: RNA repair domain-containing protein [Candidatus Nezhaarchaeales archaeon]